MNFKNNFKSYLLSFVVNNDNSDASAITKQTTLIKEAKDGYYQDLKTLITREAHAINDYISSIYFYYTASSGNLEKVREHIEGGANVNFKMLNNYTALHISAMNGHIEIVKELINAGANVNIKDQYGLLALHPAINWGHIEIVKELIKAGADVNIQKIDGTTALHSAVKWRNLEIVKELIQAGADVSIKNNYGETALNHAIYFRREDLSNLLEIAMFADELIKPAADYLVLSRNFNKLITVNASNNELLGIIYQRIAKAMTDRYAKGTKTVDKKALDYAKLEFMTAEIILRELKESNKETLIDQKFKGDMDSFIKKFLVICEATNKIIKLVVLSDLITSKDECNFKVVASGNNKLNIPYLKEDIASYIAYSKDQKGKIIADKPKKVLARFDSLALKEKAAIITAINELAATDYPLDKLIPGLKFCYKGFEKLLGKAVQEQEALTINTVKHDAKAREADGDIEAEVADVEVGCAGAAFVAAENAGYDRAQADEMPLLEPLFEHSTLGDYKED